MDAKWYSDEKLAKYTKDLSSENANFANYVVSKSIYYSINDITNMIKRSFNKFIANNADIEKHTKYNLLIPYYTSKIGSEHYFTLQLKDDFALHAPETVIDLNQEMRLIKNTYPIVIIDDAIYSGTNMCGIIDNYQYDYQTKFKTPLNNKFICIVAVCSHMNVQTVDYADIYADFIAEEYTALHLYLDLHSDTRTDLNNELAKINIHNMYFIKDGFIRKKSNLNLLYNNIFDYLYKNFKCETMCVLPIIMEHKIANEFGCYPFFKKINAKQLVNIRDSVTLYDINKFINFIRDL